MVGRYVVSEVYLARWFGTIQGWRRRAKARPPTGWSRGCIRVKWFESSSVLASWRYFCHRWCSGPRLVCHDHVLADSILTFCQIRRGASWIVIHARPLHVVAVGYLRVTITGLMTPNSVGHTGLALAGFTPGVAAPRA